MNYEILESLKSVGYEGNLLDEILFSESINEGFKNEKLRNLIVWLTNEICELSKYEERITQDSDVSNFMIELSGLLKELQSGYDIFFSDGNIKNRMQTVESRYLLLEFLISELMTSKMIVVMRKPKDKANVITIHESETAAALKDMAITLNLGKPPENINNCSLFGKISSRLEENLKAIPNAEKRIGIPLFNPKKPLNDEQWHALSKIHLALENEYNLRRKMLMTRLNVTVQSFKWSDKIKGKEKDINERYSNKNQILEKLQNGSKYRTDIVSLLASRDKLAIIEKTSSANVRKNTKSKLQRHIIGKVPDRGGRTLEQQQPPKEMPSWQKRQPGSDNQGSGRGGRGKSQNRGFHQNQSGYPPQQLQQNSSYNPSNMQYQGDSQQSQHQRNFRGHGSRVQAAGWNRDSQANTTEAYYQRGGRGRGRR